MKILYFNYLYDIKGSSLGSAVKPMELFAAMGHLGHDVKICWMKKQPKANSTTNRGKSVLLRKHISHFLYDVKVLMSNIFQIKKELELARNYRPDVIVNRLDRCLLSVLIIAKLKHVPIILEGDSPVFYEGKHFQKNYRQLPVINKLIEKINVRLADEVIVVSEVLQQYFAQYGKDSSRIHIVSNGADSNKFSPAINGVDIITQHKLSGHTVLGFIGSFNSWHGINNLAKLILQLSNNNPKIRFLLVGEGGRMKSWLEEFISTNKIEDTVIFAGYVEYEKMPEYVAAMDIVLAPYPNLPFFYYSPVKIFEYLAAGKAVVTTRIGQIAEIITDGVDGILCEPDDLTEMLTRVEQLITQPKMRKKIGEAARQTILNKHLWRFKAEVWEKICADTLHKTMTRRIGCT